MTRATGTGSHADFQVAMCTGTSTNCSHGIGRAKEARVAERSKEILEERLRRTATMHPDLIADERRKRKEKAAVRKEQEESW